MSAPTTPYSGPDFYCDVALRNIDSLDVVHEDAAVLAYHHTRPTWPVHMVVVPKRHVASLTTLGVEDEPLARALFLVVQEIARRVETDSGAARVITNLGAYQDSKHLHFHVTSGARISNSGLD